MVRRTMEVLTPMGPPGQWYWFYDRTLDHVVVPKTRIIHHETVSWNNSPHHLRLGSGADVGAPFWSTREGYSGSQERIAIEGLGRAYEGTIHAFGQYFTDPTLALSARSSLYDLSAAGATAIARTTPTNPVSGAAVFAGELREGLPNILGSSLLRERTKALRTRNLNSAKAGGRGVRGSGSEYLNVEFGWKPMMADLRKFAQGVKHHSKTIKQLHRDSGRLVRRRYHFPTETTSNTFPGDLPPVMVDGGSLDVWFLSEDPSHGHGTVSQVHKRRRWFSGAYRYFVPPVQDGWANNIDRWEAEANKILGSRLTPDVVWELAPWSWAVDWFSNTGDVLHNLNAFSKDGLTLEYGYMMEHTTFTSRVSVPYGFLRMGSKAPFIHWVNEELSSETKYRIWAFPYGFGAGPASLTPRQLAVTAAIGVTQGGRVANI